MKTVHDIEWKTRYVRGTFGLKWPYYVPKLYTEDGMDWIVLGKWAEAVFKDVYVIDVVMTLLFKNLDSGASSLADIGHLRNSAHASAWNKTMRQLGYDEEVEYVEDA